MQNLGNILVQRVKSLLVESTEINKHSEVWTGSTDNTRQRLTILPVWEVWMDIGSFFWGFRQKRILENNLSGTFGMRAALGSKAVYFWTLWPWAAGQREAQPLPGTASSKPWSFSCKALNTARI